MKLKVSHLTHYRYSENVLFSPHLVLLRPREDHHTRVLDFKLTTLPAGRITWRRDSQENSIASCAIEGSSNQLFIQAEFLVELLQDNPFDFILEPYAATYPFNYNPTDLANLYPLLQPVADSQSLTSWMEKNFPHLEGFTLELLTKINSFLYNNLTYNRREEMGVQTPDQTLTLQSGSCRDFALLFMALCRTLHLASRFVSGYLFVNNTSTQSTLENRADNAMHAWCEVYLPGAGWKGFDPTHGILTNHHFIPVAVGNVPETITPIQGSYLFPSTVTSTLTIDVAIQQIDSI